MGFPLVFGQGILFGHLIWYQTGLIARGSEACHNSLGCER